MFALNQQAHTLDREKCGMALIHVIGRRLYANCFERSQSADAEHDFLPHPVVDVTAVKLIGDFAVLKLLIFKDVRIEQVSH